MELTDREFEVVAEVWGSQTPTDLTAVEDELLIAMHTRFSQALTDAATDRDEASLELLVPLETKVLTVLHERFVSTL